MTKHKQNKARERRKRITRLQNVSRNGGKKNLSEDRRALDRQLSGGESAKNSQS